MAGNSFEVNPEGLAVPASNMRELGSRLDALLKHMESTLDGLGQPWGEDKTGKGFLKQYNPAREQVLEGLQSMAESVFGVADGLDTMRKGFEKTEQDVVDASNRLVRDPDGSTLRPRIGTVSSTDVPGGPVAFVPREGTAVTPQIPEVPADGDVAGGPVAFTPREGTALSPTTSEVPADGDVQWVPGGGSDVPGEPVAFVPLEGEPVTPQIPAVSADGDGRWAPGDGSDVPGEPLAFTPREGTALLPTTSEVPADGDVQWVPGGSSDVPGEPVAFVPLEGEPVTPSVPADK
jgi:uncharacterized protein YukE